MGELGKKEMASKAVLLKAPKAKPPVISQVKRRKAPEDDMPAEYLDTDENVARGPATCCRC